MLKIVSNIGRPRARLGRARATIVPDFVAHITLAEASTKPKNMLPQSPIKIRAGLKLKNRNPDKLPKRASITTAINGRPLLNEKIAITAQVIAEMPAARPSRPSIMFTAFVMVTIQKMVMGNESQLK